MALFKKGYESVREEKKRQEEVREQMGKRLFRFFLSGDGAEARVRFLTEEPINFYEHTVKTYRGGKERYENVLCSGDDDCGYCQDGDKPSFKGAFLIWDYSEFETKDKNGKKIYEYDTLKFQGEDNEISSIYYYFVEMRKGKWSLKCLSSGKYEKLDAFMASRSEVLVHDD